MIETGIIGWLRSKARNTFHRHYLPRWTVLMVDLLLVLGTFIVAYLLRYNFEPEAIDFAVVARHSLLVLGVYLLFALLFKSYAGLIRHTAIRDVFKVFLATTVSASVLVLLAILQMAFSLNEIYNVPISVLVIHFVELTAIMVIMRIMIKMFYELVSSMPSGKKKVWIYGAGSMGVIVKNVISSDHSREYKIEGFVDYNPRLQGKEIEGVSVLGPDKLNRDYVAKHKIESLIFAIRDMDDAEKRGIFKMAVDAGLEVLEVPHVNKWLNGQFHIRQLKKIRLEDLLSRDPIVMNTELIERGLKGRRILITGAAGSIGSELVRQLTSFEADQLILVDNAETPMFHLGRELDQEYPNVPVHMCLADVTDEERMEDIFKKYRPHVVFHAAAYKHVPLLEDNPREAIRVNVGSTILLSELAIRYKAVKFVLVSTDKAVNPTNVMGASKRMCEQVVQARTMIPGNQVQFVVTRFGNVLGSNGSVIPVFEKQISEGGPVTVTHPDVTRYFMTIPEACQLVLEAGFMGFGGEIFIFDMGEPVKINDMAKQMIRLSGYEPGRDIEIVYTGLRPGEKLYEELFNDEEETIPTYNPKLRLAEFAIRDQQKVLARIHHFFYNYRLLSVKQMVASMQKIVPEFAPVNETYLEDSSSNAMELEVYPD